MGDPPLGNRLERRRGTDSSFSSNESLPNGSCSFTSSIPDRHTKTRSELARVYVEAGSTRTAAAPEELGGSLGEYNDVEQVIRPRTQSGQYGRPPPYKTAATATSPTPTSEPVRQRPPRQHVNVAASLPPTANPTIPVTPHAATPAGRAKAHSYYPNEGTPHTAQLSCPLVLNMVSTGEKIVRFGSAANAAVGDEGDATPTANGLVLASRELRDVYLYKGEVQPATLLPHGVGSVHLIDRGLVAHCHWEQGRVDEKRPVKLETTTGSDAVSYYGVVTTEHQVEMATERVTVTHSSTGSPITTTASGGVSFSTTPPAVSAVSPIAVARRPSEKERSSSLFLDSDAPSRNMTLNVAGPGTSQLTVHHAHTHDIHFSQYLKSLRVVRSGMGETVMHRTGERYFGSWANERRSGYGVCIYPDTSKYYGTFEHDQRSGTGVLLHRDGSIYEGGFRSNEPCGEGIVYQPSGQCFSGTFKSGQIVKNCRVFSTTPSKYAQVKATLALGATFSSDLNVASIPPPATPSTSTMRWKNFRPAMMSHLEEERTQNMAIESPFSRVIVRHYAANKQMLQNIQNAVSASPLTRESPPTQCAQPHSIPSSPLSLGASSPFAAAPGVTAAFGEEKQDEGNNNNSILIHVLEREVPENLEKIKIKMEDCVFQYVRKAFDPKGRHILYSLTTWFQRYFTFMYGTCGDLKEIGSGPAGARAIECGFFGKPTAAQSGIHKNLASRKGDYINLAAPVVPMTAKGLSYCHSRQHFAGCVHRTSKPRMTDASDAYNALEDLNTFCLKIKEALQRCLGPRWVQFFARLGILGKVHKLVTDIVVKRPYAVLRNLYAAVFAKEDLVMQKKLLSLKVSSLDDVGVTYARNKEEEALFAPYVSAVTELASLPKLQTVSDKLACLTKVAKEVDNHTMYNLLRDATNKKKAKGEKARPAEVQSNPGSPLADDSANFSYTDVMAHHRKRAGSRMPVGSETGEEPPDLNVLDYGSDGSCGSDKEATTPPLKESLLDDLEQTYPLSPNGRRSPGSESSASTFAELVKEDAPVSPAPVVKMHSGRGKKAELRGDLKRMSAACVFELSLAAGDSGDEEEPSHIDGGSADDLFPINLFIFIKSQMLLCVSELHLLLDATGQYGSLFLPSSDDLYRVATLHASISYVAELDIGTRDVHGVLIPFSVLEQRLQSACNVAIGAMRKKKLASFSALHTTPLEKLPQLAWVQTLLATLGHTPLQAYHVDRRTDTPRLSIRITPGADAQPLTLYGARDVSIPVPSGLSLPSLPEGFVTHINDILKALEMELTVLVQGSHLEGAELVPGERDHAFLPLNLFSGKMMEVDECREKFQQWSETRVRSVMHRSKAVMEGKKNGVVFTDELEVEESVASSRPQSASEDSDSDGDWTTLQKRNFDPTAGLAPSGGSGKSTGGASAASPASVALAEKSMLNVTDASWPGVRTSPGPQYSAQPPVLDQVLDTALASQELFLLFSVQYKQSHYSALADSLSDPECL